MERVDLESVLADDEVRTSVSDPLSAEEFSLNYYALDPGEEFSGGLHAHLDQEESFLVLEGEATFEWTAEPAGETETATVGAGQMVRFPAGEYQQGRNEADEPLRALALGTPEESSDVRVAAPCRECGDSDYLAFTMVDGEPGMRCPECGETFEA